MQWFEYASAGDTLMDALIVMTVTFIALIALFAMVRLFTLAFGVFGKKRGAETGKADAPPKPQDAGTERPSGELILTDVDEETAAIAMALVAEQSGISPERLIFRSIKLIK